MRPTIYLRKFTWNGDTRTRDIPRLILEKNLFGLDIDDRAAQLAGFALLMKARSDDNRILDDPPKLNVISIQSSEDFNASDIANHLYESDPQIDRKAIIELVSLFKLGKTIGSLIRIPDNISRNLPHIGKVVQEGLHSENMFIRETAESLEPIINQAMLLSSKYDCVVANPPYMGSAYFNSELKSFVNKEYKTGSSDLYGSFIQRNTELSKSGGMVGMITIPNWMFLSSFEKLRRQIIDHNLIESLVHNGRGIFGSDFGTCSFVLRKITLPDYVGVFRKLFEKQGSVSSIEELESRFFSWADHYSSTSNFHKIPGSRIAYEVSKRFLEIFEKATPLGEIAEPRAGLATGDNTIFQRQWFEPSLHKIGLKQNCIIHNENHRLRWYPCHSGGDFRKWYGNHEMVVDWENNGSRIKNFRDSKGKLRSRPQNIRFYFQPGITWTKLSSTNFAARFRPEGFVFDDTGRCAFPNDKANIEPLVAFLCSSFTSWTLKMLNPSMSFTSSDLSHLPVANFSERASKISTQAISIARNDWDAFETSWDFKIFPWLNVSQKSYTTEQSYKNWESHLNNQIKRMMELETENNRLWIDAYGLQNELDPEVTEDQITLARPDAEKDVKRLLSYAIGCMMGRYSLDEPGLVYANSGNIGFNSRTYTTFPADEDGILPITDMDWFPDDVANRFVEFISRVWPKENLEENLKFIADSLSGKKTPDAKDTIRKYISSSFFKDHLQTYKNRPIYWLFSSGKQKAFECLVYLHRYNEGTLSRMRSDYVIPLQGKLNGRIALLERDLNEGSQKQSTKVRKEIEALKKKQTELTSFDDRLRHYADMKIFLDLDDGVKVNYGKFGDLLAEVGKVTGKK